MANEELPILHTPPVTPSLSRVVAPVHTTVVPVIVPGDEAATVSSAVASVPQPVEYVIVAFPELLPETIPLAGPIVATELLLLLQVPPVTASLNVVVNPVHTFSDPIIVPGAGVIVITLVSAVPQPVE